MRPRPGSRHHHSPIGAGDGAWIWFIQRTAQSCVARATACIRRSLLRREHTLTLEEHQALFTSTRLFERIILLLRQLQTGLEPRYFA